MQNEEDAEILIAEGSILRHYTYSFLLMRKSNPFNNYSNKGK